MNDKSAIHPKTFIQRFSDNKYPMYNSGKIYSFYTLHVMSMYIM